MGKWFGQASEIEELRAENRQLKEQVATLEARLRAAYADAGVTALAGASSPASTSRRRRRQSTPPAQGRHIGDRFPGGARSCG